MTTYESSNHIARVIALLLSAVAAYFSVFGLMEIFSASKDSVMVMAIILEAAKVAAAYWTHINWKILPWSIKGYAVFAIIVLMGITTLGIYGFLAKAHIDQKTSISINYDTKINKLNANIENRNQKIQSVDNKIGIIDGVVKEASDAKYVSKALELNKKYEEDRNQLVDEKTILQNEILDFEREKIDLESNKEESQAKIGPLKYVVSLLYGDNVTNSELNNSVRWLIIILVAVFDPLAIALLIGTGYIFTFLENPIKRAPEVVTKPAVFTRKPITIKNGK